MNCPSDERSKASPPKKPLIRKGMRGIINIAVKCYVVR
jgi:hypothetical protein